VTDSSVASEPADSSVILAERTRADIAARERTIRRALVGVAVLILHVVVIAVFIYSSRIPLVERVRSTVPAAIIWFVFHPNPAKPHVVQPPVPQVTVPEISLPITAPPIPARPLPAPPQSGGLLGIGRSLACGASSYENLSAAQRQQCLRHPWHFARRPDGTIVLDVPKPTEPPPSAIDIIRHEQQTAPPCPILNNVPCLGKVLHGDPSGGGPSPF
jgi:hypothetical protein